MVSMLLNSFKPTGAGFLLRLWLKTGPQCLLKSYKLDMTEEIDDWTVKLQLEQSTSVFVYVCPFVVSVARNCCTVLQCLLYPRHLCRGVYSFRLSVRPFVCSYVRSFVCSFVRSYFLPSRGICVKVLR